MQSHSSQKLQARRSAGFFEIEKRKAFTVYPAELFDKYFNHIFNHILFHKNINAKYNYISLINNNYFNGNRFPNKKQNKIY